MVCARVGLGGCVKPTMGCVQRSRRPGLRRCTRLTAVKHRWQRQWQGGGVSPLRRTARHVLPVVHRNV